MTFFHFKLRLFLVQYRTNKSRCLPEVCACPVSRPRNRLVVQSCQDDARSSSRLWPFNKFMGRYFVQYFMQGSLSPLSHFDPSCHLFGGGERRVESGVWRAESRQQRAERLKMFRNRSQDLTGSPASINPERCQCRCHCSVGGGRICIFPERLAS
jgi:hypothetical protein